MMIDWNLGVAEACLFHTCDVLAGVLQLATIPECASSAIFDIES